MPALEPAATPSGSSATSDNSAQSQHQRIATHTQRNIATPAIHSTVALNNSTQGVEGHWVAQRANDALMHIGRESNLVCEPYSQGAAGAIPYWLYHHSQVGYIILRGNSAHVQRPESEFDRSCARFVRQNCFPTHWLCFEPADQTTLTLTMKPYANETYWHVRCVRMISCQTPPDSDHQRNAHKTGGLRVNWGLGCCAGRR